MNNPDFEPIASNTLLFGTVSGAIGVIATISEDRFRFLQKLERCIDKTVGPIGGLTHSEYPFIILLLKKEIFFFYP